METTVTHYNIVFIPYRYIYVYNVFLCTHSRTYHHHTQYNFSFFLFPHQTHIIYTPTHISMHKILALQLV